MADSSTRDILKVARPALVPTVPLGEFYLLTIGIDHYEQAGHFRSLHTAVCGASEVAQTLREHYGFAPERAFSLLDGQATREAIIDRLHELAVRLGPDDSLMVYYAGHGCLNQSLGIGYWIPVDGVANKPASWVDNSTVKNLFRGTKARHVLLISDSCFAGDFFRESAAPAPITEAYAQMAFARSSRQALTSGGLEPVRDDGAQGHSVFTWFLLRELRESGQPYLLPSDLHARIRGGVAANARQQPLLGLLRETGGEEGGEFVLFRQSGAVWLEELIRRQRERLTVLEEREQEVRTANAARQAEMEGKAQELKDLERRIQELQDRLFEREGAAEELDELVAMVVEQERRAAELERLRQEAEKARRVREQESERLQNEELKRREQEFEADRAKYARVYGSKLSTPEAKTKAWEALCRKWKVDPRDRGELVWANGSAKVLLSPEFATKDHPWENSLGMKFVPVPNTRVLFCVWVTRVKDYTAYAQANSGINGEWRNPGFDQGPTKSRIIIRGGINGRRRKVRVTTMGS